MITYLEKKLANQKIKQRLSSVFIFILVAFIAIILVVSNVLLYWTTINKTKKEIRTNCELLSIQMDTVYNNAHNCLNILTKDINRIYNGDTVFGTNAVTTVSLTNNLYSAMYYSKLCFPTISSLVFVDINKNVVAAGCNNVAGYEDMKALIEQIPKKGSTSVIEFPIATRTYMTDGVKMPVWVLGQRVFDMNTGKNLGYLFAVIRSDVLSGYFPEKNDLGYSCEYQLVDKNGGIVAAKNKEFLLNPVGSAKFQKEVKLKNNFKIKEGGEQYLITSYRMNHGSWLLINKVKIKDLTKEIRILFSIIIAIGLSCIGASAYLINQMAGWITKPIQNLTDTAEQIRNGDLSIRCDVNTTGEIGTLSEVFNEMLERIEQLLQNVKIEQQQKREYELALIQAQIKPHFLYNTLDLIYIFCQTKNTEGGAKIAKAMADYYRTSLSNGQEIISIADEIKNISSYLYIQKERYCDLIDFTIDVDKDIYSYRIPKMTLQPLVENSIYHGLKSKGKKGEILVKGSWDGYNIRLSVEDSGVGMDEGMIEMLLSERKNKAKKHFGLSSVNKRIKLYYGQEYGIKIESRKGAGTRVVILIPRKLEE